jgi:hypothetical protein
VIAAWIASYVATVLVIFCVWLIGLTPFVLASLVVGH